MAKRIFHATNWSATALADTTAATNATYMALKGGSSTQLNNIVEVWIGGLSNTTAPVIMQLARVTTVETTPTALASPNSDGPMHPSTAALGAVPVALVAAAAGPQRSAATTDAKLDFSFNAFGGISGWKAAPGCEYSLLGNTQPLGEVLLSAFTGTTTAPVSAHLIYEPL